MDWSAIVGGIVGVLIGVTGGVSATLLSNRNARDLSREERIDNRRARTYVDVLLVVQKLERLIGKYAYGPQTSEAREEIAQQTPNEEAAQIRAYLAAYGSAE